MFMADRLTLDAPRRTADGYMAVRARAARTGVYQYAGTEIDPDNRQGLRDTPMVNVLRDDKTVFDETSVRSFLMKPVTDDHPSVPVTAKNWKDHARGVIAGAMRDGDHLAFDLLLMDEAAIAAVDSGKRELSNGYDAKLEFGDFTAEDGTKCQARQDAIFGNHVALVKQGRAGSTCRIGDAAMCDAMPSSILDHLKTEKPVKTMLIDGFTVDLANVDTAIATVNALRDQRDAATAKVTGLETQVATLTTDKASLEAKVTTLEASKPTPSQLRDAAKAFALVADHAAKLGVKVSDDMGELELRRAAVNLKVGDAAKDWSDDQIAASFGTLTAQLGDTKQSSGTNTALVSVGDAQAEYDKAMNDRKSFLSNAWRGADAAAA